VEREKAGITLRVGYGGHAREFRLGRTGQIAASVLLALLFAAVSHSIYDMRESAARAREISALRRQVSEQNLTLYGLYARFEGLETEFERLRAVDARVRALVRITGAAPARPAVPAGIGGAETPGERAPDRLDRLLDLRLGRLEEEVLVQVTDLEQVCERLDVRRVFLESLPSIWPVRGPLSSGYGIRVSPFTETEVFHQGVDIMARPGTPVRAAAAGRVVRSGSEALLGNVVEVDHGHGYRTVYAHLAERLVEAGAVVQKGDPVGKVGATGRTTGPHLHYEVRLNGLPLNPLRFVN